MVMQKTAEESQTQVDVNILGQLVLQLMEDNKQLRQRLDEATRTTNGGTGKGRPRMPAQPQFDTKTGKVYHSKSAAGMAVAREYNLPVNNFIWYEVIKKDDKRFRDATPEEVKANVEAGKNGESGKASPATKPTK